MAAPQNKKWPPVWIWPALTGLLLCVTAIVYQFESVMQAREYPARAAYLLQRYKAYRKQPVILILGTSMTQCALDSTERMERAIEQLCGRRPVLIKIWKPAGRMADMVKFMPQLQHVHPDIVVAEANMFFYLPDAIPLASRLYSAFNQLVRCKLDQPYFTDAKPKSGMLSSDRPMSYYRQGLVDTTQLSSFRQLAEQYQKKGTHLLLINIPLKPHEEYIKWQSADTSHFKMNLYYLGEAVHFSYLNIDCPLNDSCFIDIGHLNESGSKIYSQWLTAVLAKELQKL